jgi:hypothetical protein
MGKCVKENAVVLGVGGNVMFFIDNGLYGQPHKRIIITILESKGF